MKSYLKDLPCVLKHDTALLAMLTQCKDSVQLLMRFLLTQVKRYSLLDFAIFKIGLISLGLWIGSKFSNFFRRFRIFLFLGFVASSAYMIWRTFIKPYNDR